MTILPKKKQQISANSHQQQQATQQSQQDGRHGVADSSGTTNGGGGGGGGGSILSSSTANSGASAIIGGNSGGGTTASSISTGQSSISSFLSTSTTGTTNSASPHHHGGDNGANNLAIGGGIGGGMMATGSNSSNSTIGGGGGGIRRPLAPAHLACHDPGEIGDGGGGGGLLMGPHRKRAAVGSASPNFGASSPARGQTDRSSPYRTNRRSNRTGTGGVGGGNSALLLGGGCGSPRSTASSPASVSSTLGGNGGGGGGGLGITSGSIIAGGNSTGVRGSASPETRNDEAGYNSEDEYERVTFSGDQAALVPVEDVEQKFEETLGAAKGYRIKKMKEDGACLFRAVADQVYGDEEMHTAVRKLCMDYMAKNSDYFNQFVTEDFAAYIERKRQEFVHGNHVEIQAMAELFNRPIQVYQYSCDPINTFHSPHDTDNPAIRVSYHGNHYNSIIDPYSATIGVGLGLPQFYPGLAEKNLMQDAVHASEKDAIEEAMLEDKLRATDWEATDEHLQEQAARESYLQWLRDQEKQMKENAATRDGVSSMTMNAMPGSSQSPDYARPSCSKSPPNRMHVNDGGDTASASVAGSSRYGGANRWEEEDDLFKQVLALSQQEYFDSMKRQEDKPSSSNSSS